VDIEVAQPQLPRCLVQARWDSLDDDRFEIWVGSDEALQPRGVWNRKKGGEQIGLAIAQLDAKPGSTTLDWSKGDPSPLDLGWMLSQPRQREGLPIASHLPS
jgi:hypothetical protein